MSSIHHIPRVVRRLCACLATAGCVAIWGCSSEVGSSASGEEQVQKNSEAQAVRKVNPQVVVTRGGRQPGPGQGPRSIKQRIPTTEPGK